MSFYDEDDDDYEDDYSDHDAEQTATGPSAPQKAWGFFDSDDDDDTDKREVLSRKQRRIEELREAVRKLKTHVEKNRFIDARDDFKKLKVATSKFAPPPNTVERPLPHFYVKHMQLISHFVAGFDGDSLKDRQERASLRELQNDFQFDLPFSRQLDVFQTKPKFWKDDDDADLGDDKGNESDEFDDDDDWDGTRIDTEEKPVEDEGDGDGDDDDAQGDDDDDGEYDNVQWDSDDDGKDTEAQEGDSDQWSWDDDDDDVLQAIGKDATNEQQLSLLQRMKQRSFWVKKPESEKKKSKTKEKREKKPRRQDAKAKAKDKMKGKKEKPKAVGKKDKEKWTGGKIRKAFQEVLRSRGAANVNRSQIQKDLRLLIEKCEQIRNVHAELTCISVLVSFFFDSSMRKEQGMPSDRWKETYDYISRILQTLETNTSYRMSIHADLQLELPTDEADADADEAKWELEWQAALEGRDVDDLETAKKRMKFAATAQELSLAAADTKLDKGFTWIHGDLWSFVRRLQSMLWKNIKFIDANPQNKLTEASRKKQYARRLDDSQEMKQILERTRAYYEQLGDTTVVCAILVQELSLVYTDYDETLDALVVKIRRDEANKTLSEVVDSKEEEATVNRVPFDRGNFQRILMLPEAPACRLAKIIFEHEDVEAKTEAILYLAFFLALHNHFELTRDVLLMSHLCSAERVSNLHVETQILYNRALAQFSICAFNWGEWEKCSNALQDLFSSNKTKELIAQDKLRIRRQDDKTPNNLRLQELENQRLLPSHIHINVDDELEATHLLSTVFFEVPSMVSGQASRFGRRNRHFRRLWDSFMKRDFRGPPENTRDTILTIAYHMHYGSWKKCEKYLEKLKIWGVIRHSDYVKEQVRDRLKEETMRCFLYRYGTVYQTISLERLSRKFGLDVKQCKLKIFKMKQAKNSDQSKLRMTVDEAANCLIVHSKAPTPLQRQALEFADKLGLLAEQNERQLGIKSGVAQQSTSDKSMASSRGNRFGGGRFRRDGPPSRGGGGRGRGRGRGRSDGPNRGRRPGF